MQTAYVWFIFSILCFVAEATGVSGIGLLFAAIAAFCIGLFIQLEYLGNEDFIAQGAAFFALTAFWALILWHPLKRLRLNRPQQSHQDMVGRLATVTEGGLVRSKPGHVRWSGTTMRARLAADAAIEAAAAGDELKIVGVDGSTLILAQKDYPLTNTD